MSACRHDQLHFYYVLFALTVNMPKGTKLNGIIVHAAQIAGKLRGKYITNFLRAIPYSKVLKPRAACVASIMEKMFVTEERANQLIHSTDKYRAKYYNYYTCGKVWTNPINYDLVLNRARVGRDKCVKLIVIHG